MRRLLLSFVVLAAVGLTALPALAQDASSPPVDEFSAFRDTLKKNAAPANTAPVMPNVSKSATKAAAGVDDIADIPAAPKGLPAASPLGPAGALPVNSKGSLPTGNLGQTPQTPDELQAMMDKDADDQKKKMEDQVFNQALKALMPLKPEQIRKTLENFRINREAAETPITVPEPRQEVVTASLDPSDAPVVIKMAPNTVTTVTILDATGAPWPIQDMSWAGAFTIAAPESGGHIFRITPSSAHGVGNISIRLIDMITPVTMRLTTGLDWVHYRLDVRIPKPGPLAKTPIIEYGGLKTVAGKDDQMVGILDGMPPDGSEKLQVNGVDGRTTAYQASGHIYLRTPLTLLSPAWDSSVSSADGMSVYTLAQTPVVLLSDEGRMVKAHIVSPDEVTP
ncbi:MAG: DotH/IcmK family type IV secretion protein [Micavibrio sp.]|nr:DotH/IcmK family type IV secretion protein [Micavibrio sp.]